MNRKRKIRAPFFLTIIRINRSTHFRTLDKGIKTTFVVDSKSSNKRFVTIRNFIDESNGRFLYESGSSCRLITGIEVLF